jgi:hypothetical protein
MEQLKFELSPELHKKALILYIMSRLALEDWHGVSDACNDLRELEAANPELKKNDNHK